jgi:hypothetical protein
VALPKTKFRSTTVKDNFFDPNFHWLDIQEVPKAFDKKNGRVHSVGAEGNVRVSLVRYHFFLKLV